ncbi:MAG: UPF0149 family protein [Gammaproteobacteria bacterium]|nr:UPF0149 family protein [Gammaproteobacteria bacterium]
MDDSLFSEFSSLLSQENVESSLPEQHGMLCGMLCRSAQTRLEQWLQLVEVDRAGEPPLSERLHQALEALYQLTIQQLNDDSYRFSLVLPADDAAALNQRVLALAEWCSGFLYGMGMSEGSPRQHWPAEVTELIQDFADIARLEPPQDQESDEEDEVAYAEFVEYVRIGVLFIYQSLQPGHGVQQGDTVH